MAPALQFQGAMVVTIQLFTDDDSRDPVQVSSRIDLETDAPGWQAELVSEVAERARDAASCLLGHLLEPIAGPAPAFVPRVTGLAARAPAFVPLRDVIRALH